MIRAPISAGARGHVWMDGCCGSFPFNDLLQWHSHRLEKTCMCVDFYILPSTYVKICTQLIIQTKAKLFKPSPKVTNKKKAVISMQGQKEQCLSDGKGCCYSSRDFSRTLFISCVHCGKSAWKDIHLCLEQNEVTFLCELSL